MEEKEQRILQKHLSQFLVQEVFNTVSTDDLLKIQRSNNPLKSDVWLHKGQELPKAHVEVLKNQANSFAESELWKVLKNEMLWHVQEKGLYKSQTESDQIAAKVMLYLINTIESKLGEISR